MFPVCRIIAFDISFPLIIADVYRKPGGSNVSRGYIRAGPRQNLHFNPSKVNSVIVTCGGLCPGLNNVI